MFVEMFVAKNLKNMATLRFSVLSTRQTSKKTFFIYLTITHKREVRYISTGYEIDDLYQFDKGKVVCRKDAQVMNQRLGYVLSEYREKLDAIDNLDIYTCSQIKEILEGRHKQESLTTIKEYMEKRITLLRKEGRDSYADMNVYTLDKIISIIGNITLQSISPVVIDKFIRGMGKLSNATKQMRLTHLKACINEAIRDGLVKYDVHPFAYVKMPKPSVKLLDITIDEFTLIMNLKTRHKKLTLARDLFLLSFYLGGMNLADIVRNEFDRDTISYVRKKTANKREGEKIVTFTIPEEAKKIIRKYISRNGKLNFGYQFTYSNFQRYVNHCLKELAKKLGIKSNLSFYSARKTFSQFAFDLGIRTEIVEYCLGQSMKENRPIYNYIRIMQKQADAAIRMVIDYTNDPSKYELKVLVC